MSRYRDGADGLVEWTYLPGLPASSNGCLLAGAQDVAQHASPGGHRVMQVVIMALLLQARHVVLQRADGGHMRV